MDELLPWHRSHWQRLMQSRSAGRLPHALLCAGPQGLGKRIFVERLAKLLLCRTPAADNAPCGDCRSCRLFAVGNHPDFVRVEPVEEGRPIRVEQIRELSAALGYTSQFGGYKIALLIPAEALNINAANSLLKTLEEPPPDSMLLMVTALPSKLAATVRSRCQNLSFHVPLHDESIAWLKSCLGNDADPALLLSLANGAPLTARHFAGEGRLARRKALFNTYSDVLLGKADPMRSAEAWVKGSVAENLGWLISWHMDMIRLKISDDTPSLANSDLRAPLRRLAERLPVRALFRSLDAATRLHGLMATQVNLQLMIEVYLSDCVSD